MLLPISRISASSDRPEYRKLRASDVTTAPPNQVREFTFKGAGGRIAKLFDGTEKILSWDNILWIYRSVLLP